MKTFSAPNGDIDLTLVDDLESVMQRISQRLHFRLGEWFENQLKGTDYEPLLGATGLNELAIQALTAEARSVEDVDDITNVQVNLDGTTRILTYNAIAHTRYGSGDFMVVM